MLSIAAYNKAARWPRPQSSWMQKMNRRSASMSTLNLCPCLAFRIAYFFPCRQSAIYFGMPKSRSAILTFVFSLCGWAARFRSGCLASCVRVVCQIQAAQLWIDGLRPISRTQVTISSQLILRSTTYPQNQARTEALWEAARIAVVTHMTAKGGPRLWHSLFGAVIGYSKG